MNTNKISTYPAADFPSAENHCTLEQIADDVAAAAEEVVGMVPSELQQRSEGAPDSGDFFGVKMPDQWKDIPNDLLFQPCHDGKLRMVHSLNTGLTITYLRQAGNPGPDDFDVAAKWTALLVMDAKDKPEHAYIIELEFNSLQEACRWCVLNWPAMVSGIKVMHGGLRQFMEAANRTLH